MSGNAELAAFYSVLSESARLLGAPCSPEVVWPILNAYEDIFAQSVIAFRVETGVRHAGELDCRFTMIPPDVDPYARALSSGLTPRTDHPAGLLLEDIRKRFPIDNFGVNFGLADGFRKTWQFFPPGDMQKVSRLTAVPSMPSSLAGNAGFFARHGLDDKVCLTGIDYPHKTMNVYFGQPPAECLEPETVTSMHRENGLPEPGEQLCRQAVAIYVTLSWNSPRIERISYTLMTSDPMALTGRLDPEIEQLTRNAPASDSAADRRFLYYVATSASGEYRKLLSFYRWQPRVLNLVLSN